MQRTCYLLPNVLFVITGRNRLDWAELAPPAELDYVGRMHWPHLHPDGTEEPRQHLLGYLSPHDCEEFLRSVFASSEHQLAPTIEQAIIVGSGGLPLYLDLEVAHYLELLAAGVAPTADMFGGPLSAVVARSMRDMTTDERGLLRSASLLRAFDADLLGATAGDTTDANVERFLSRPFIEHNSGAAWPYGMHNTLRDTIRLVDHELPDGWSDREWRQAAERAMGQLDATVTGPSAARPDVVAGAFATGMSLSSAYGLSPEWLITAAKQLADLGYWGHLDLPDPPNSAEPNAPLEAGFRGVALRRLGRLPASIDALDECLRYPDLSTYARRYFTLHRANSLRNSGRYDTAEADYRALLAADDDTAEAARYQLADIALLHGEFTDCVAMVDEDPTGDPYLETEYLRLRGHAARFSGLFEPAELHYRRALDIARRAGSVNAEGKAMTNLAECACWVRPTAARRLADEAVEFNKGIGNRIEVIKALAASAIADADPTVADSALSEGLDLAADVGYAAGSLFCHWGQTYQAMLRRDYDAAERAIEAMRAIINQIHTYRFLLDIAHLWVAPPGTGALLGANQQWLDGPAASTDAWRNALTARQ